MATQHEKAKLFHSLHRPGAPLVLVNVWDAGTARAVTAAGARALATASWAVAAAHGFEDGEKIPLELALANARRIVDATDLPVTMDLESGYGATPGDVANTVAAAIRAGVIGCNLEDSDPLTGHLRPLEEQVERLQAVRGAATVGGVPIFLNARSDVFLAAPRERHDRTLVGAALERAQAYARAGADGFFAPGLKDPGLITELCAKSPLPVNVIVGDFGADLRGLAGAGVARVSFGPTAYLHAMKVLEEKARPVLRQFS